MTSIEAFAKINLGLVVGPVRADGKHEVATLLERLAISDTVEVEVIDREVEIVVEGFDDTIVRAALTAFADVTGVQGGWHVGIDKRIPVAAGLGGGSSDAAAALRLANELSGDPLGAEELHGVAASVGADVPFFLADGAQLATGDGSELAPVDIPHDVPVVVVLPRGQSKQSTADVYARFDERRGAIGFDDRRETMLAAVQRVATARDLAALLGNDLAASSVTAELVRRGAFRADVSGAGPAVYGLFDDQSAAERAAAELGTQGATWLTRTVGGR